MILADFGADVTIISRDMENNLGLPIHMNYMNRGKKSIVLNLKDSNHLNVFKKMI